MTLKAIFRQLDGLQDYTPSAAAVAGDIIQFQDGRAGVVEADLAASQKGAAYTRGIFDVLSATGTLFSIGEDVWWDGSNAVKTGATGAYLRLGVATIAKISGDLVVRCDLNADVVQKNVAIVAGSAAVSNTVTETVVATATIKANTLKVGSILDFFAKFIATATNSTDTFRFLVRIGGVAGSIVFDSTAIDLADNDACVGMGQVVIRTDGASGTMVAAALGQSKTTVSKTVLESTAIDTTADITLVATITESVASASNSARCDIFNVVQK